MSLTSPIFKILRPLIIFLGRLLRLIYRRLPIGEYRKSRLKAFIYRLISPLIRETASFQHWEKCQSSRQVDDECISTPVIPPVLIIPAEMPLADMASQVVVPTVTPPPDVSILIPAFNQIRFTLRCLAAISANPPRASVEIIVIDDYSSDETQSILEAMAGIRYIRNEINLGFVGSINRGAACSRGRYLHLLNNDTEVQANWLDALLAVFQDVPAAGIVGSKLIYPNGYLQEAGARLKRDGSVELIGVNDNPSRAVYNFRRQVDHCSGASILIEKKLFDSLGGLDPVYSPAFYEDCDLSLRVMAAGLRIIYQPDSVVVHHLSVTTAQQSDAKIHQISKNKPVYLQRWHESLQEIDSVKLIAFYLPQFHPIPENDYWWGRGFTEWTNVTRARPKFSGHYQPHLPADLGFYDLRLAEARQAQADLARRYGIFGFCYYYYWFNGKRLLHRPLDDVLKSGQPDFPFCICWANENWSRRWDGRESEILLAQHHSDEDDLAFIRAVAPIMCDQRYIRVNGRPLLLVYRIELLPNATRTSSIWRDECHRVGIGEIYLACVRSFGAISNPTINGFDAAVEFPPHERAVLSKIPPDNVSPEFRGLIYDYAETAKNYIQAPIPEYPFFRAAMPGWDNTPRRQNDGHIFFNSTPDTYFAWLSHIIDQTRKFNSPGERLVFINAWNEWAEGNHLEPDQLTGHSFLEATLSALDNLTPNGFGDLKGSHYSPDCQK